MSRGILAHDHNVRIGAAAIHAGQVRELSPMASDSTAPLCRYPPRRSVTVLLLVGLWLGCDAQVDSGYLGEPLVTLHGRVASAGNQYPVEAALLWQRGPPPSEYDTELAALAPVEVGFPAAFTLRLCRPPPETAFRSLAPGEVSFARANAAAVPAGTAHSTNWNNDTGGDSPADGGNTPSSPPGYSINATHWIVFLPESPPIGSLTEWWLGGALRHGYTLLTVSRGCRPSPEIAECIAELQRRGVPEDGTGQAGTASGYCRAPYRLSPAPEGDEIVLEGVGDSADETFVSGGCP